MNERDRLEDEIQALCKNGELNRAVERALRGYGPELRRMMGAILRDDTQA